MTSLMMGGVGSSYASPAQSPSASGPTPAPAATVTIVSGASTMTTTAFSPNPLNISVGTTVTWVNSDSTTHTSTADGGAWNSPAMTPGGQFSFTFPSAGTFSYHCSIHPGMVGTVNAACPVITLAPPTAPAGTVGVAYSQQITASGGSGTYSFTVLSGTLPAALTLSSGGLLSGTPTAAGSPTVTLQAADANGCPGVISYTIDITTAVPTLPQAVIVLLALGLTGVGYFRLRRQARAE